MVARGTRRAWRVALLLPHPPLSLLYLFAMRAGRVRPHLGPVIGLAVFPLAALLLGIGLRAGKSVKSLDALVTALAVVELVWALACIAIVNVAAVWRLS